MLCTGELHKCACGPETLYVHGLRSEWLCKFACEQIVTDKECIGANKLTAYEALPELTTQVQIREAPPSHCLTMSSGYGVSLQHPDVRYSRAFRVPV